MSDKKAEIQCFYAIYLFCFLLTCYLSIGGQGIREGFCEQNPQKLFSSEEYGREVLLREAGGPPQRQPIRPNYASLRASFLVSPIIYPSLRMICLSILSDLCVDSKRKDLVAIPVRIQLRVTMQPPRGVHMQPAQVRKQTPLSLSGASSLTQLQTTYKLLCILLSRFQFC
jgi:hypothetical protein